MEDLWFKLLCIETSFLPPTKLVLKTGHFRSTASRLALCEHFLAFNSNTSSNYKCSVTGNLAIMSRRLRASVILAGKATAVICEIGKLILNTYEMASDYSRACSSEMLVMLLSKSKNKPVWDKSLIVAEKVKLAVKSQRRTQK